jgi:hypothetical protein
VSCRYYRSAIIRLGTHLRYERYLEETFSYQLSAVTSRRRERAMRDRLDNDGE